MPSFCVNPLGLYPIKLIISHNVSRFTLHEFNLQVFVKRASTIHVEFFTELYIMSQAYACMELFQNWSGQNWTSQTASAGPVLYTHTAKTEV